MHRILPNDICKLFTYVPRALEKVPPLKKKKKVTKRKRGDPCESYNIQRIKMLKSFLKDFLSLIKEQGLSIRRISLKKLVDGRPLKI